MGHRLENMQNSVNRFNDNNDILGIEKLKTTEGDTKHSSKGIIGDNMDFTHYKGARKGTGQFRNITVEPGKKTTYEKVSALDASKNFEEYVDHVQNPTVMKTVYKKKKFGTEWEEKRSKEISLKKAKRQALRKSKKG